MKSEVFQRLKSVPPIVRIIIAQAVRRRAIGSIGEEKFREQMRRLATEELNPKGLELLVRDREGVGLRFIVKETRTGKVCDMIDFALDGNLEDEADADPHSNGSKE